MIFFTDRDLTTIAVADYDTPRGVRIYDDNLNQKIDTGTALFSCKIDKTSPSSRNIEAGNFVIVPDFKGRSVILEVMECEENRNSKQIIAEDAGLELLNGESGSFEMKGILKDFVQFILGPNSSWKIGLDEIGDSRNLTLKYDGVATQTKRLVQIAGRFNAEISYSFDFDGNRIKHKYINFHKKRGSETGIRLEVGKEIKDVTRTVSHTNLMTAIKAEGQTQTETIKVEQPKEKAKEQTTKKVTGPPEKLKKFISWFKSREGKVGYSMNNRLGPRSYDCSSAIFFAAKVAGLIPKNHWIGNTETLFSMKGKYLTEISLNDVKYGDIFVAGRQGGSGGSYGHTGAFINKDQIIHCNYTSRGIATTKRQGRTGGPPVRYFRWKNAGPPTTTEVKTTTKGTKAYWTHSNLTHHDLGHKLQTLSAQQINNWVKATAPRSQFVGQGAVFMEAQRQSGLDARYILAHAALESAWGNSNIAKRYNNYFGIGAFDSNPDNARNYSNSGLAAGIIGGANWIAKNYYNSSYKQTTLYKMRHNNGVHQYATDPNWHTKIARIMKQSEKYTKAGTLTTKNYIQEVKKEKPAWPTTKGLKITSGYGQRRAPTAGATSWHAAIDIGGGGRTHPIYATQDGTVIKAGWINGGGNMIRIKHSGDNYYSQYQHLSQISVKINQKVKKGQRIGTMGTTGVSTGIHLDFAISKNGTFYKSSTTIDPRKYLNMSFQVSGAKAAQPTSTSSSSQNTVVEKQIEKETNLIGYEYDDGRFFVDETGILKDREANKIWNSALSDDDRYIVRHYDSQATSQKTLFDEALLQLKSHNEPEMSYNVALNYLPDEVDIGDVVRIIDHDYNPPLYLDARLVEVDSSLSQKHNNSGVFSNFETREAGIYGKLYDLQSLVLSQKYQWDSQPYEMMITSSNGNVFKDGIINTDLTATVSKSGIGQTEVIDRFEWQRVSAYPDKNKMSDEEWNKEKEGVQSATIDIDSSDVDLEATFTVSAYIEEEVVAVASYTIKDLTIGIYKQKEEPDRSKLEWGDVWQFDDGDTHFKRIWRGDSWEDAVTKRDLEIIELTPGPPGRDGEDGMPGPPGKDGRTPYVHFAYADSIDGTVGFTKTATKGKDYIGMYTDYNKEDSDSPADYFWSRYTGEDGKDGIPGPPGADGKTPYFHQAWSNAADGSVDFSVSESLGKAYLGTYSDYIQEDSMDYRKYNWQLVKGPQGVRGPKGAPGEDGQDGASAYDIARALGFSGSESDWLKSLEGEDGNQGVPGQPGKDGRSSYLHIAYADSADGRIGFTISNGLNKKYLGQAVTFSSVNPSNYSAYQWTLIQGPRGEKGEDGRDGKTGQLGQNLLINSNQIISNSDYLLAKISLQEQLKDGEQFTLTVKLREPLKEGRWLRAYNGGRMIQLGELKPQGDVYVLTDRWKSNLSADELYLYHGPNENITQITLEWAVLARGDIPANDWYMSYQEMQLQLDEKAPQEQANRLESQQQALEVYFESMPTPEQLKENSYDIARQQAYLEKLEQAINSDRLSLEDRIKIIEANVGAGKLSIEAITSYFEFGEEGVLIGKQGEQVKMTLAHDALEIVDGTKVVARFANNQADVVNLKVSGTFEFGYHVADKLDQAGKRFTTIRPL